MGFKDVPELELPRLDNITNFDDAVIILKKSALELFNDLGFELIKKNNDIIIYEKKLHIGVKTVNFPLHFNFYNIFTKIYEQSVMGYRTVCDYISFELNAAIQQQLLENKRKR